MGETREIPCSVRFDGEVPVEVEFLCLCGAYWTLTLPVREPQPYAVDCNCGREFLVYEFPCMARVWQVFRGEEE